MSLKNTDSINLWLDGQLATHNLVRPAHRAKTKVQLYTVYYTLCTASTAS